jgi:hypothetical protein
MARSSSGRSVARAAATGGGATYRGQMPVNWYAALLVIVLIGIGSVAFAKYHYNQNPPVVEPTVGTTWHAGLAFDICGTMESPLAASPASATGLTTTGDGILKIAPANSGEAGNNATLGKFASGYSGLTLTNTAVKYPLSTEYKNGDKCAKGTPDAGQVGEVSARSWLLTTKTAKNGELEQTGGNTTVHPADLKLADRQLITVGFVPDSVTLPKPPASPTISGLLQVLAGGSQPVATTTTAPAATPTSAPSATTSSVPASTSTTTAPPSTTTSTTKPPTTTTTK